MTRHALEARLLVDFRAVLFRAARLAIQPLRNELIEAPEMLHAVRFPVSGRSFRLLGSKLGQQWTDALLLGEHEVLLDQALELFLRVVRVVLVVLAILVDVRYVHEHRQRSGVVPPPRAVADLDGSQQVCDRFKRRGRIPVISRHSFVRLWTMLGRLVVTH